MKCPKCQFQNPEGIKFCGNCGAKLKRVEAALGKEEVKQSLLDRYLKDTRLNLFKGWISRIGAEILMFNSRFIEAKQWLETAIETEKRFGKNFHLAKCYRLFSQYYKKMDDGQNSRRYLFEAIDMFRNCGADGWVEIAERDMADLSS